MIQARQKVTDDELWEPVRGALCPVGRPIAARVAFPATPSAVREFAFWNFTTAAFVDAP